MVMTLIWAGKHMDLNRKALILHGIELHSFYFYFLLFSVKFHLQESLKQNNKGLQYFKSSLTQQYY